MKIRWSHTTSRLAATLCGGVVCAGLLYTATLAATPTPAKQSDSTILKPLGEASKEEGDDRYRVRVRLVRNSSGVALTAPAVEIQTSEPAAPTPAVAEPQPAEPTPIAPPIRREPLPQSPPTPTPAAPAPSQPELLPEADVAPPQLPTQPSNLTEAFDIGFEPIGEIDVADRSERQTLEVPPDRASEVFDSRPVNWSAGQGAWPVPASPSLSGEFCYRPLYFEEANLERYGNRCGFVQPVFSAARFYATIPALPYLAAASPPNECRYERFPYQAGASAPRVSEMPPLSVRGGLVEAGTAVGLIFLIP